MSRRLVYGVAGAALACALVGAPRRAAASEIWDQPAFSAPPRRLLAAADAVEAPEGVDVVVLLEEGRYRFDAQGRSTFHFHRIFKVLTQGGVSSWAQMSTGWAPWYEARPEIRVRVIDRDGRAYPLDPAAVVAAPARGGSSHTYSDVRSLRAPFPNVAVGAVIEEQAVYRETQPYFAAGANYRFNIQSDVPIHRLRFDVDAPASLGLRVAVMGTPEGLTRRRRKSRGRVRYHFAAGDLDAVGPIESYLPPYVARVPHIDVSTGRSWASVARRYAAVVDGQIAAGDVSDLASRLPATEDRARLVAAALALVNDNVRYTGLELGDSAIVPWTPKQTWERRYGDCKDKATLLVALLRAAKIDAHVALLKSGRGEDIPPHLPGLSGFDHAIVYVPGPRPVWIDPTVELARAGQLPLSDQGRWALVAAATTRKLARTPTAASSANATRETREIELAEIGPARVVETSRFSGSSELWYRGDLRDTAPKDLRKRYASYVESNYSTKHFTGYRSSDPGDLDTPLSLTIEADELGVAASSNSQAWLRLDPLEVTGQLPDELLSEPKADKARRGPMALPPKIYEITYRVKAPPGFEARPAPPPRDVTVGTVSISERFTRPGPRQLVATLRLDTGSGRLTAAQVAELQKRLAAERKRNTVVLGFDQIGQTHLDAGRVAEAATEFRRLIALHPNEGLHHTQLANVLVAAGLGRHARAEARRAAALEPRDAENLARAAWILLHDDFGRLLWPGAERARAIALYRKAIHLDPKTAWIRAALADVYSYGDHGVRFAGDLDAAIRVYQKIEPETGSSDWQDTLLTALAYAGRFGEVRDLVRRLPPTTDRVGLGLAAAGALDGEAGLRAARDALTLEPAERRSALQQAGRALVWARRYRLATWALREAGGGTDKSTAALLALIQHVKRQPAEPFSRGDPRRPVDRLLRGFAIADPAMLRPVLAQRGASLRDLAPNGGTWIAPSARREMAQNGMSSQYLVDSFASMFEITRDGATGEGWRLRVEVSQMPGTPASWVFVVSERGKLKVLTMGDTPAPIGAEALRLARRHRLAEARVWLDWAAELRSTKGALFATMWNGKDRSAKRVRLAAAVLAAGRRQSARAVSRELRRCPSTPKDIADACLRAASVAAFTMRDARALRRIAARLAEVGSSQASWARVSAALLSKDLAEAQRLVDEALEKIPDDDALRRMSILVSVARGRFKAADEALGRWLEGSGSPSDYLNERAWNALFLGVPGDDVLEMAKRAASGSEGKSSSLNTLAAVHAARGEYADARNALIDSMEYRLATRPRSSDWLILGRIYAGLGYTREARAAYARVKPAPPVGDLPGSSPDLAKRWAAELDAKKKPKK